jgi:hypothetical protein
MLYFRANTVNRNQRDIEARIIDRRGKTGDPD